MNPHDLSFIAWTAAAVAGVLILVGVWMIARGANPPDLED